MEAINTPPRTEQENAMQWLMYGEQGLSSKTMFRYLYDHERPFQVERDAHPSDPSDFRRCCLLLKQVPQFRAKLDRMRRVSSVWNNLVDNWDKLTELLEEQMLTHKKNDMYKFMRELGC